MGSINVVKKKYVKRITLFCYSKSIIISMYKYIYLSACVCMCVCIHEYLSFILLVFYLNILNKKYK